MKNLLKTSTVLNFLIVAFVLLAGAFMLNTWGRPWPLTRIPLVDSEFLTNAPIRVSYSALVAAREDLSDFDCYGCHDRKQPPPIRYDTNHVIIIPKEHETIVLRHGRHDRNNNCFNCHNEQNLEHFQTRDGRQLSFTQSTALCGSCHGPTYRDWDAGAHGRTTGFWNRTLGSFKKLDCVDCHNPHAPQIPQRKPAPGPHPLRRGPAKDVAISGKGH